MYHRKKGHRTSGLLFNFWLLLVLLAIPQLMAEIRIASDNGVDMNSWKGFQNVNYFVYFAFIVVMLLLNCFSDKAPLNTTYAKYSNPSPELSASFLRKIFFQWFDSITWKGWRNPLTEADMYDINPADASRELVPPFDKYFQESVEKGRR
jgi:ATP-binding cassette, subfamily C (CFTR/MRP), member 1